MRLLNTRSLEFKEFFDNDIPKYAILSHRWGDEEITFQEFRKGKKRDSQGYAKVKRCCALAEERGEAWVWVDTCCIDKRSSAELSEAINSMYRWYKNAQECYVYLSDVAWNPQDVKSSEILFTQSSWFTRGWTLQELIAPEDVGFFDSEWNCFGTKDDLTFLISAATGITMYQMQNPFRACIAQKMSWVSKRKTSRSEDMAYCMLGLFDVNMPLLYGEGGPKAFMRLQLEIIKQSDDDSIFAWTLPVPGFGLLAPWPSCFTDSGDINLGFPVNQRFPYQMTNQGLQIEVREINRDRGLLELNCWRGRKGRGCCVKIQLIRSINTWERISCKDLELSTGVEVPVSESKKRSLQINVPQPRSFEAEDIDKLSSLLGADDIV